MILLLNGLKNAARNIKSEVLLMTLGASVTWKLNLISTALKRRELQAEDYCLSLIPKGLYRELNLQDIESPTRHGDLLYGCPALLTIPKSR